jgi:hypothetical protein
VRASLAPAQRTQRLIDSQLVRNQDLSRAQTAGRHQSQKRKCLISNEHITAENAQRALVRRLLWGVFVAGTLSFQYFLLDSLLRSFV